MASTPDISKGELILATASTAAIYSIGQIPDPTIRSLAGLVAVLVLWLVWRRAKNGNSIRPPAPEAEPINDRPTMPGASSGLSGNLRTDDSDDTSGQS